MGVLTGVVVETGVIELAVIVEGVEPAVELAAGATGVMPREVMQAIMFLTLDIWEAVMLRSLAAIADCKK